MPDVRSRRLTNELFLAAVGRELGAVEPWVTDRLTAMLEEQQVSAGDCIFSAGEPPDHLYFVRQGSLEIVREGRPSDILEGPRAVGLLDALVERPRSRSAYARTPLELLRVPMDAWFELLEESFELARTSVRGLARAVSALEERAWSRAAPFAESGPGGSDETGRPLDIVERVVLLLKNPLLRGAGVQPVSDLAALSDEVCFEKGALLFERGAPARIYVPIDGHVVAEREKPVVTWRGGGGCMVCGAASLAGRTEWRARASTRTRALAFDVADWFDRMEENFDMARATMAALAVERERLTDELGPSV